LPVNGISSITQMLSGFPIGLAGGAGYGFGIRYGFEKMFESFRTDGPQGVIRNVLDDLSELIGPSFPNPDVAPPSNNPPSPPPPIQRPVIEDIPTPPPVDEPFTPGPQGPQLPPVQGPSIPNPAPPSLPTKPTIFYNVEWFEIPISGKPPKVKNFRGGFIHDLRDYLQGQEHHLKQALQKGQTNKVNHYFSRISEMRKAAKLQHNINI
jgi:hypothetical protein